MDTASRIQGAVQSLSHLFSRKAKEGVPPRLANPVRYPFGEFELQLHASPGQEVELQISRDFKNWETLDKLVAAKEVTTISDKKAGAYGALFYRAVAGAGTSNYLGFLSVDLPPGYSLISNPLRGPSNEIGQLFSTVPEGCTINKYSLITFTLNKISFARGKWSSPLETLAPGEGALFFNASDGATAVHFVGEVPRDMQSVPVQTGTSMRGSLLPLAGRLDSELGFPVAAGDVISIYSNHNEKYAELKYTHEGWEREAPILRLGEGFWVAKSTAAVWKQRLPE